MVRLLTPSKPEEIEPPKPKRVSVHWRHEMAQRRHELARADGLVAKSALKPAHVFADDMDIFEAAMFALLNSDLHPDNGFVPEAAPGFAALLVRIAEQTAAEFGPKAAAEAFRELAERMPP